RRVLPHQRADGVQRVEEEVRVQPVPQRLEPRPRARRLAREGPPLALRRAPPRQDSVGDPGDDAVEPDPHEEMPGEDPGGREHLEEVVPPDDRVRSVDREDPARRVPQGRDEMANVERRAQPRRPGVGGAEAPDADAEDRGGADRERAPRQRLAEGLSAVDHEEEDPEDEERKPRQGDRESPQEKRSAAHRSRGQDSAAFHPRLVGSPTRFAGSPKPQTRGPRRGGGSRSEALMRNVVRVLVFLAYILALAAGFLLFAEPAPPKADARDRVAGIVGKIVKADYGDDRPALRRLYDELAPYTAQPGAARFASRVRYWRRFALWRRVLNGFNDKSPREGQEADLAG